MKLDVASFWTTHVDQSFPHINNTSARHVTLSNQTPGTLPTPSIGRRTVNITAVNHAALSELYRGWTT